MLAITLTVNLLLFAIAVGLAFLVGFLLRGSQLKKWKKKVIELETEMLRNHADILDLQKDKAALEQNLKTIAIPVIPINASKDDKNGDKLSDGAMRKQVAAQQGSKKHS